MTRIEENYKDYANYPICIFKKAYIYENLLKNQGKARQYYEKFVADYPDHELAEAANSSLVFMGMSDEELINIFEKNTPLHDGAVIIRGDRVVSATCYLPLSDNMGLSKDLGTRHRAAVGISEVSDSLTIVVSEETGTVSYAREGRIVRDVKEDELIEELKRLQNPGDEDGLNVETREG